MPRTIFIVGAILMAGGVFFFYTKPVYDGTQALAAQNAQYDAALAKAAQLQQIKESLLQKYNSFDPNALARLSTMLPDQVDNIRLILDLDSIAAHYNMGIQNVDIAASSPGESNGSGVIGAIQSDQRPYNSLTLTFTTTGTYSEFKRFLGDLDSSLRLVDVVNMQMSGGTSLGGGDPQYTYSLTLQTYWLR